MLKIINREKSVVTNFFFNEKQILLKDFKKKKIIFFVDNSLKKQFYNFFKINKKFYKAYFFVASEKFKKFDNVKKILSIFYKYNVSANDLICVVSGGSISDAVSFAASIYRRGIQYYMIPTTTMSAVDASSAGKTCINLFGTKNLIGSYHYAKKVFIFDYFLKSEPIPIKRQGYSEILKYALLGSKNLYKSLINKKNEDRKKIFSKTIIIRDKIRKIHPLISNLGHTYAHALEGIIKIGHGDSVSLGIMFEAFVALQMKIINEKLYYQILSAIRRLNLYSKFPKKINHKKLLDLMLKDKKSKNNKIGFVFIKKIGQISFPKKSKGELFYQLDSKDVQYYLKKFYEQNI